jgi:hypothetical protein
MRGTPSHPPLQLVVGQGVSVVPLASIELLPGALGSDDVSKPCVERTGKSVQSREGGRRVQRGLCLIPLRLPSCRLESGRNVVFSSVSRSTRPAESVQAIAFRFMRRYGVLFAAQCRSSPAVEAGATQERTLEAVRCKPLFGPDAGLSRELCAGQREICILVCGVITPWSLMISNFAPIQVRRT